MLLCLAELLETTVPVWGALECVERLCPLACPETNRQRQVFVRVRVLHPCQYPSTQYQYSAQTEQEPVRTGCDLFLTNSAFDCFGIFVMCSASALTVGGSQAVEHES